MQKRRILIILLALGILVVWRQIHKTDEPQVIKLVGTTMGTVPYSIKYLDISARDFQRAIDSILIDFNNSLSTYIPTSEISRFNESDTVFYDTPYLLPMLQTSQEIFEGSKGAFDPTLGPLINAWGFGATSKSKLDSSEVKELLTRIGFDKVDIREKMSAKPKNFYLDFSATAKGYAIDVIADFLETQGIKNMMVEIGGEVVCKGKNDKNAFWKIGIEKPQMNRPRGSLFATTFVKNTALATSGNYRNYYEQDGQIISHTISPYTGFPVQHNLLSASIFAPNCALADGYATACMVLGLNQSIEMIEENSALEGLLIFSDPSGKMNYYISGGVQSVIEIVE